MSQRLIARHGLEHLGISDRGVTLYRREMRKAVRMVERGEDPPWILREPGKTVPTHAGDTMLKVPPASTEEEDRKLVMKVGHEMAKRYLKDPPHLKSLAR